MANKKKTTTTREAKFAKAGRNRGGHVNVTREVEIVDPKTGRVTGKREQVCRENLRHGKGSQRAKLWHYTGTPLHCLK